jgi:hypothetical protein
MLNFTDSNSAISVKYSVLKEVPQFAFRSLLLKETWGFIVVINLVSYYEGRM